jgi:hypothetical protein
MDKLLENGQERRASLIGVAPQDHGESPMIGIVASDQERDCVVCSIARISDGCEIERQLVANLLVRGLLCHVSSLPLSSGLACLFQEERWVLRKVLVGPRQRRRIAVPGQDGYR